MTSKGGGGGAFRATKSGGGAFKGGCLVSQISWCCGRASSGLGGGRAGGGGIFSTARAVGSFSTARAVGPKLAGGPFGTGIVLGVPNRWTNRASSKR